MNKPVASLTTQKAGMLALLSVVLPFASSHASPRGEDLLRAALKADRTVSYVATETTTRTGAATVITRVQKSGGKRRVEYSAPAIMKGDLLIDDGANQWLYHRAEKSAVKTKTAGHPTPPGSAEMKRMKVTVQGRSNMAGRKAWLVVVSTRDKKRVLRKFWIDEKTKARLRMDRFDDRNRRVESIALSNLKFGAVPSSAFRWKTPSGVKVTNAGTLYQRLNQAKRATSWLQIPYRLPKGYAFESAIINSGDAWLRYSNGVRRFSIFQQRTADKKSKPMQAAGSGWYWQKNGNRFIIAGLNRSQAELVSDSVR